jgi:hypothetical protein
MADPPVPRIFKRFWFSMLICTLSIVMIVVFDLKFIPYGWRIPIKESFTLMIPLVISASSHILFPVCPSRLSMRWFIF